MKREMKREMERTTEGDAAQAGNKEAERLRLTGLFENFTRGKGWLGRHQGKKKKKRTSAVTVQLREGKERQEQWPRRKRRKGKRKCVKKSK